MHCSLAREKMVDKRPNPDRILFGLPGRRRIERPVKKLQAVNDLLSDSFVGTLASTC
jgi:hypothetical protein